MLTAKSIGITHFLLKSYKTTRTKNPECESIRDFYFGQPNKKILLQNESFAAGSSYYYFAKRFSTQLNPYRTPATSTIANITFMKIPPLIQKSGFTFRIAPVIIIIPYYTNFQITIWSYYITISPIYAFL